MEWMKKLRAIKGLPLLLLGIAAGILLLWIGGQGGEEREETNAVQSVSLNEFTEQEQRRLAILLDSIVGVSQVKVCLTLERGDAGVTGNRDGESYTAQRPPEIAGCVVVCRGGGDAKIQLAIISVVCALYGLPSSRVSVQEGR